MASILSKRFNNNNWLKIHYKHCFHVNHDNINSIIIGDAIVGGLTRYNNIWKNLFGNGFINLEIRGDFVENGLLDARDLAFLPLKNVQGLIAIGSSFKNCFSSSGFLWIASP